MKVVGLRRDTTTGRRYLRRRQSRATMAIRIIKREATPMHFDASHNKLSHSRRDGHGLSVALPILMVATLSWWSVSPAAAQAAAGPVDASMTAGDDFYAYANSAWLKATTIPAGRERL